jgi:hypothetical protein
MPAMVQNEILKLQTLIKNLTPDMKSNRMADARFQASGLY